MNNYVIILLLNNLYIDIIINNKKIKNVLIFKLIYIMFIPLIKKGSIISIYLRYYQGPLHLIQGVCIKKKNKGWNTYITIKSIINNEIIIQTLPLYTPYINKMEIIK